MCQTDLCWIRLRNPLLTRTWAQAKFCSKAASTTSCSPWKAPLLTRAATYPPAWSWTSGQPQTGAATRWRRRRLVIKWLGCSPGWLQSVLPGHFIFCFTPQWQGMKTNGSYQDISMSTGDKLCTAAVSLKMNFVSCVPSVMHFSMADSWVLVDCLVAVEGVAV